jgi:hypothetical protein
MKKNITQGECLRCQKEGLLYDGRCVMCAIQNSRNVYNNEILHDTRSYKL